VKEHDGGPHVLCAACKPSWESSPETAGGAAVVSACFSVLLLLALLSPLLLSAPAASFLSFPSLAPRESCPALAAGTSADEASAACDDLVRLPWADSGAAASALRSLPSLLETGAPAAPASASASARLLLRGGGRAGSGAAAASAARFLPPRDGLPPSLIA
jgi:hypothetical protein